MAEVPQEHRKVGEQGVAQLGGGKVLVYGVSGLGRSTGWACLCG